MVANFLTWRDLIGQECGTLAGVDPILMNLLVAKGIPSLADLEICRYQAMADDWVADLAGRLPDAEAAFHQSPQDWKDDINFFRLGMLCWYVDEVLGIHYREDQRDLHEVLYTDPSDLFLNGVMDSRRGTCGNTAALHVALGWRLRWPVSLACVNAHFICRYDDGSVTHNIEATNNGKGGFHSHPDQYYIEKYRLSPTAIRCGSDLRSLTTREMLACYIGLRARHLRDTDRVEEAEADYLLARHLFPNNRHLYIDQTTISIVLATKLFQAHEKGHPISLARWLQAEWLWQNHLSPLPIINDTMRRVKHESNVDSVFAAIATCER